HWRTHATFDEVVDLASRILSSPTVMRTVAATYPLVIVDEFQDCTAGTLALVQALARASQVLLAADHFQKLPEGSKGRPAVEWVDALREENGMRYEDLTGCRRTENAAILTAARALRDNVKAADVTVPVFYAPDVGPAAVRIVGRFASWGADRITDGSCALIVL